MPIIENVTFFYTKIQQPAKKYQSEDTEYSVDCAVDKATAKKWNKEFPKQKAKEFDNDEFLEKYKVEEVPFPDQDEQYIIKLKKNAVKDGRETPEKYRPKVLVPSGAGNLDVTATKLVGNGSTGKVSYNINENSFGAFAQLSAILVTNLIEYKQLGGAGSEFGAVVGGTKENTVEEDFDSLPPAKASNKTSRVKTTFAGADEDPDPDSPF